MGKEETTKKLKEEIGALDSQLKRALADYDNLHRRVTQEKEVWIKQANLRLIKEMLPLIDLLKRAQEHSSDSGLKMVTSEFDKLLTNENLETFGKEGDKFDPHLHEVVEVVEGGHPGKIAAVVSSGYKIGDQLVQPARVKVYHDKS